MKKSKSSNQYHITTKEAKQFYNNFLSKVHQKDNHAVISFREIRRQKKSTRSSSKIKKVSIEKYLHLKPNVFKNQSNHVQSVPFLILLFSKSLLEVKITHTH